MILENKQEEKAFKFICNLASAYTNTQGCNDLNSDDMLDFKDLKIIRHDAKGVEEEDVAKYDFDIIEWITKRKY